MKRIYILLPFIFAGSSLPAQGPLLTHENHSFIPGTINEMKWAEYLEPGNGGENQVWDLSGMVSVKDFTGTIQECAEVDHERRFSESNVVLNEFCSRFFFRVEDNAMKMYGMASVSGKSFEKYDQPFVKMVFPFKFGDSFSGDYHGRIMYPELSKEIPLEGTYMTEADGYGKLILPGGKEYYTMRVKYLRSYELAGENPAQFEIVSYRWYTDSESFPLAVLQTVTTSSRGNTSVSKRAAYKESVSHSEKRQEVSRRFPEPEMTLVKVYPNPAQHQVTVEYTVEAEADVLIELYDNTGQRVATLVRERKNPGLYTHEFETEEYAVSNGMFIIRSRIGLKTGISTFIKL